MRGTRARSCTERPSPAIECLFPGDCRPAESGSFPERRTGRPLVCILVLQEVSCQSRRRRVHHARDGQIPSVGSRVSPAATPAPFGTDGPRPRLT